MVPHQHLAASAPPFTAPIPTPSWFAPAPAPAPALTIPVPTSTVTVPGPGAPAPGTPTATNTHGPAPFSTLSTDPAPLGSLHTPISDSLGTQCQQVSPPVQHSFPGCCPSHSPSPTPADPTLNPLLLIGYNDPLFASPGFDDYLDAPSFTEDDLVTHTLLWSSVTCQVCRTFHYPHACSGSSPPGHYAFPSFLLGQLQHFQRGGLI